VGQQALQSYFRNVPHSNFYPEVTNLHEGAGFLYSLE